MPKAIRGLYPKTGGRRKGYRAEHARRERVAVYLTPSQDRWLRNNGGVPRLIGALVNRGCPTDKTKRRATTPKGAIANGRRLRLVIRVESDQRAWIKSQGTNISATIVDALVDVGMPAE